MMPANRVVMEVKVNERSIQDILSVKPADLPAMAKLPYVAMIEQDVIGRFRVPARLLAGSFAQPGS